MDVTRGLFVALVACVAIARLIEMRVSRRHQKAMAADGLRVEPETRFALMVALHTGILLGAVVEVCGVPRAWVPSVSVPAFAVFLAANGLRLWVIRVMGRHWNVRVVDSGARGVVTRGPFRWIRHPNYVAVFVELLALPLVHGAYVTAFAGAVLHAWILAKRIALEEEVLFRNPLYRAEMSHKPRFIPALRLSAIASRFARRS